MVGKGFERFGVDDVYFGPVGTAARYGIGYLLAILRHGEAGQCHCAVVAQRVGVEHDSGVGAEGVHAVEHRLVLQTVVLVEIIASVFPAPRCTPPGIVVKLFDFVAQGVAEWYFREVAVGDGVLGFHPFEGRHGCVVFERTIWIGYLNAEILIDSVVGRGFGINQIVGLCDCCRCDCHRQESRCKHRKFSESFHAIFFFIRANRLQQGSLLVLAERFAMFKV